MDKQLITGPIFYGGEINCVLGPISEEGLDKILDILDDYDKLVESIAPAE